MELSLGGWKAWNSHAPQMAEQACAHHVNADGVSDSDSGSLAQAHAHQLEVITLRIASSTDLQQALPPLLRELHAVMRCGLQSPASLTGGLARSAREEKDIQQGADREGAGRERTSSELYVIHRSPAHKDGCVIAPSGVAIPASTRQWLISAIDAGTDSELEPSASPLGTLMALTSEASAIASWLWLGESLAGSLAEPLSESALYPPAIEALSRGLTLQHLQQARQATAIQAAVAQAVQAERRNLAAELHDTLAQELSYLQMQTSRLTRAARQAPSEVQTLAEDVHVQTRRAFRQTRELINGAHAVWGDAPLACVLDDLILEFETRSNMVFELDNRIQSLHLPDAESLQVMFIVREALTNSVRHAHATHLRLQLLYPQADQVSIAIEDNGNGFDPAEIAPAHFGLGIMQDRARSIGAQFSITQRRHGGTRVAICWERNAR